MAIKFYFEELNGPTLSVTCSALSHDTAHRILSGAHFREVKE